MMRPPQGNVATLSYAPHGQRCGGLSCSVSGTPPPPARKDNPLTLLHSPTRRAFLKSASGALATMAAARALIPGGAYVRAREAVRRFLYERHRFVEAAE